MIRFNCDYNEGAHPRILETLVKLIWSRHRDMVKIHIAKRQQK